MECTIGVLALQGAFREHLQLLGSITISGVRLRAITVRTPAELIECDAIIIPGGESTTMSLIAQRTGMLQPLRDFVHNEHKAAWGTCAGMILLADQVAEGSTKKGGQEGIGGLPIRVVRNQFGRQVESFEAQLAIPGILQPEDAFLGIFIRAPIMQQMLDSRVQVLATLTEDCLPEPNQQHLPLGPDARIVAVRRGRLMATSFHPELTNDARLHELFIRQCVLSAPAA